MTNKIKVEIKFKQLVEYNVITELSKEEFDILEEREYDDVDEDEPAYKILNRFASNYNMIDTEPEFTDVQVIKK